jgi:hypothetical protein
LPAHLLDEVESIAAHARARKAAVLRACVQHALATPEGVQAVVAAVTRTPRVEKP